jgi:S-DNA-T family DNA segregation ATPase FtsK/SpoIIIE
MQAKKKNTSVRKKTAAARKRTAPAAARKKKQAASSDSRLKTEIIFLVILAFSILLVLSNFGLGGAAGRAFSSFFFGLFGLLAYVFPFLLFIAMAFLLSNRNNPLAVRKVAGGTAMFVFACVFMQLLMVGWGENSRIADYFSDSAYDHLGGGLVGGMLARLFGGIFGTAGAYVVIIAALIISAIILTQKPLLTEMKNEGSRVYQSAMERRISSRRARAERVSARRARGNVSSRQAEAMAASADYEQTAIPDFLIERGEEEPSPEAGEEVFPVPEEKEEEKVLTKQEAPEEKAKKKNPRSSRKEIDEGIKNIREEISDHPAPRKTAYRFPPLSLLKKGDGKQGGDSNAQLKETAAKLQQTLHNFGVNVTVTNVSCGPTVTRYELQPEQGVKVSRIVNLADDIKLNLAAKDIRIEAPIPGKAAVGIEVPNRTNSSVMLRDLLETQAFRKHPSRLAFAVGKDIAGQPVVADIAKMPHLLIAGATGSGKSVCINTLIVSILYKATPDEVRLIMIDPKVVELSVYNGIPHLYIPVVTDPKKAAGALNWAVSEMTDRYNRFAELNVRDLSGYNARIDQMTGVPEEDKPKKLPQIVIVVDELADLMMVAPGEVEDAICRLAQLARAAGIHLIIATQRPSVNVITGLIKANMPSRIALATTSGVDSRTILDMNGAEKLLGKGDMLFYPQGYQKPARVQGAYISDDEIVDLVEFLSRGKGEPAYDREVEEKINSSGTQSPFGAAPGDDQDAYFADAGKFIIEKDKASIGMLQRAFKIGFNRAARIMDQLCDAGVVGEEEGTKPRKILMTMEQFENYLEETQ